MDSQTAPRRMLGYGEFLGTAQVRRNVSGFSLADMVPELPPEKVPEHTHVEASFVLIVEGAYLSSAEGAGPVCGAPTLIYNPPGTTHRDRFQTLAGRFLAISVSYESLRHAMEYVLLPDSATTFHANAVVSVAQRIARECACWGQMSPLVAEALCLELLAEAARQPRGPERRPPAWLQRARELLHEHSAGTFRLADAARMAGVHPVHLAQTFRHFFRHTPGEYLRRCRAEKAASLLVNTELPLAELALRTGSADQSHLTKVFKRWSGLSPGAYRRLFRRKHVQI